ncbi:Asp-tRNA(Asn)/Glu-tRNA(Gln) amidotransferase subunit GatB [Candidatus Aquarickettsia rohweri]|uniref:Aspartyl/glutamyl-tRNA(Asn/Gln) amidotransferase subunit B n=1 Tax=Candidatus Aquarickettsia rohweri TaxID=2602574 RepID=A0A3R9XYU7_9RICK|nr:Asp-tRNA(Asn)/Glu-tRNA(Gln) amidotransferase subunit GatB [Candidatus Aquarickettsia rohweri]RST69960.1 Asp-tRNA(Asn)/Glu-tRNA(Gln) amidotransferase subunit GatB [Candidatus Aquarickettsia rohweri]
MIIQGKTNKWELVIGLEIHAQLNSKSKLFSHSSTKFGEDNNEQVSYIDAAMPGMLPITNKKCIELAIKAGLAVNAKINTFSVFDRKNYFYPDSPQGYQISQLFYPIVSDGNMQITKDNGEKKTITINRIHIEQDAGKSIHDQSPIETFIDFNRVGVPLIEIVTDPNFNEPSEVEQFMKKLRNILRYIDVCDGDLEKGSMRCDANVSVRKKGDNKFGTRVEIKNLNSFKYINKAILYEANRQVELLEEQQDIVQETRLFDVNLGQTKSMRKKEEANDYRYFPDPDLLTLKISADFINNIKNNLPELPEDKKRRYINNFHLTTYDAEVLTADKAVAEFFEIIAKKVDPKLAANWICAELFGRLNKKGIEFYKMPITSENFCTLLQLITDNKISGKIAKDVLDIMFENNNSPEEIVKKHNLMQISGTDEIEKYIDEVLNSNPEKVKEFKSGKEKLFGFFVGQVMKISKGKANPQNVNEILTKKLHSI